MIHTTQHQHDITVVRPGAARLTAVNAKAFKDELVELVNQGATQLVIDFDEVSFVDSSGLGALVGVLKKVGMHGELVVAGLNSDVAQMFRICRMDRVFTIYADAAAAVQALEERA